MALSETALPVCLSHELAHQPAEQARLIDSLWEQPAVGILGGAPKCAKSWRGLDMALSVASATPCLCRFTVPTPGPAVVYLAEDALPSSVRARLEALLHNSEQPPTRAGLPERQSQQSTPRRGPRHTGPAGRNSAHRPGLDRAPAGPAA